LSSQAEKYKGDAEALAKTLEKETKKWSKKIASLATELSTRAITSVEVAGSGEIPSGKVVMRKVRDVFDIDTVFEVPCWEWDGPHPDVPAIDNDYIFRPDLLVRALYALVTNQRMYLQGDTGSGKTTLVEQIAARLNYPFGRINFDSEITRMDLIGRDVLKEGKTEFIDGFLPKYLSGPYIICFDEIDFVRPDVAYAMQAALEGNGIVITEDGGRRVKPHPMARMFGTGNTVGQGDEKGMYQGARPQSIAFLDRFTIWAKVPYLDSTQRKELLSKRVPALTEAELNVIIKYSDEHLIAFDQAKVLQPISPRGIIAVGQTLAFLNATSRKAKNNLHVALSTVVLDRATQGDYATLKGIVDRVCKG
jgi:cobaltochelatase CobS